MGLIGATAFSTVVWEQWQIITATRRSVKVTHERDYYMICSYELTLVQTKKVAWWYEKKQKKNLRGYFQLWSTAFGFYRQQNKLNSKVKNDAK